MWAAWGVAASRTPPPQPQARPPCCSKNKSAQKHQTAPAATGKSGVSLTRQPGPLAGVAGGWRAATHRYGALKPAVLPSAHVMVGPRTIKLSKIFRHRKKLNEV